MDEKPHWQRRVRLAAMMAGPLLVILTACSQVQVRYPDGRTEYQSREEFAAYVEQVFRYQNRVLNDLIVYSSLVESDEFFSDPELLLAERTMARECRALIDAVAARLEGGEPGFFQKLSLPASVPACEQASRRLELLLPAI
jgi:hypothetical protein